MYDAFYILDQKKRSKLSREYVIRMLDQSHKSQDSHIIQAEHETYCSVPIKRKDPADIMCSTLLYSHKATSFSGSSSYAYIVSVHASANEQAASLKLGQ